MKKLILTLEFGALGTILSLFVVTGAAQASSSQAVAAGKICKQFKHCSGSFTGTSTNSEAQTDSKIHAVNPVTFPIELRSWRLNQQEPPYRYQLSQRKDRARFSGTSPPLPSV